MSTSDGPPVLRFDRVTVRYGETAALDNVSYEMREGATCVILGAAGSGKTVFLKTALGLIVPDEGQVTVFGADTATASRNQMNALRARMGILFQEGGLFDSLTIAENVAYPLENQQVLRASPEEVQRRVEEALTFVELGHTLAKFPSEVSGGMRRRVGIARAIVTHPELLFYDSPTAGLDPITANTIMALIAKERDTRRTTTALATHRYQDGHLLANYRYNATIGRLERDESAGEETRFLVMGEGRIVFEGTQDELEASRDPYVSKFAVPLKQGGIGEEGM